jgi:hypothetical protein
VLDAEEDRQLVQILAKCYFKAPGGMFLAAHHGNEFEGKTQRRAQTKAGPHTSTYTL